MRLIDADALKRKAQKVATEAWKMKITGSVETVLNQFIDWIDDAPTIEPEIVRCKDCNHWSRESICDGFCSKDCMRHDEDFYCGYAERKTDRTLDIRSPITGK